MGATDVTQTLDEAIALTGVDQVPVKHRPRLLSDNGSAYLSNELRDYLGQRHMTHTRGAPYHPQTQGKIERYHRTMKNVVKLQHYYFPWELEASLRDFVAYYNNERSETIEVDVRAVCLISWTKGTDSKCRIEQWNVSARRG